MSYYPGLLPAGGATSTSPVNSSGMADESITDEWWSNHMPQLE